MRDPDGLEIDVDRAADSLAEIAELLERITLVVEARALKEGFIRRRDDQEDEEEDTES